MIEKSGEEAIVAIPRRKAGISRLSISKESLLRKLLEESCNPA